MFRFILSDLSIYIYILKGHFSGAKEWFHCT